MENKKKVKVISFVSAMMLFVIVVAAAFAYFSNMSAGLANNVAVNVTALEGGDSVFSSNATQLSIDVPASSMDSSFANNETAIAENTATLSVNLISGDDNQLVSCTYDIVYEYDYNSNVYGDEATYVTKDGDTGANVTKEITMQVSGPSVGTNNYATETNFNYDSSWIAKDTSNLIGAKKVLVSNASISNMSSADQTTQNWTFTGKYYNLDIFQTQLSNEDFTGKIYVENKNCEISTNNVGPAGNIILANNGGLDVIKTKEIPVFTNNVRTNEGMYMTIDDQGLSYYFRGAVDNNWIKFGKYSSNGPVRGYYSSESTGYYEYNTLEECNSASSYNYNCSYAWNENDDIYWRIIRINGDGSIRLLYTGTTAPIESEKSVMTGIGTQIGTSEFNGTSSTEYVGYKYEIGKQHGLANDSRIKSKLENWYTTTTLNTDTATKKLVADNSFCYDRTAYIGYRGPYGEIDNWQSKPIVDYTYGSYGRSNNPSLKCANELDKYSVNKNNGNGALIYPVGLITADEILLAGGIVGNSSSNKLFYLYTGQYYWTGSPSRYNVSKKNAYVYYVDNLGNRTDYYGYVHYPGGVRPVINLSKDANLSGDGTWNNPYVVES